MNWLRDLRRRCAALLRKRELDAEMDEEFRTHLDMQRQENLEAGMTPGEARYAAMRQFGRVELLKETCRDERGVRWLDELGQDVRFGVRILAKNKTFSAVVILTLGLGIGANTAVFSVVNSVLLRPLPYPEPEQLALVRKESRSAFHSKPAMYPWLGSRDVLALRDQHQVFSQMAAYEQRGVNLTDAESAERVSSGRVSDAFFSVFGARLALGRGFLPEEDRPGGPGVAVLSHAFWQKHYGADRQVLGRTLKLDDDTYTIVGVLAAGFEFMQDFDVLVPLALGPDQAGQTVERSANPQVVCRLKPGVTLVQAREALDIVYKATADPKEQGRIVVTGLHEYVSGNSRLSLLIYMGAVAFVLLIACANVANLLLARAANRRKEVGIRVALGASRFRIIRQFLVESLLLSAFGSACGLLLASCTKNLLCSAIPRLPSLCVIRIDGWVLSFTLLIAAGAGLLFGLAPALEGARLSPGLALAEGERSSGAGGRSQRRLGRILVISELALASVLLVGAALLVKSFVSLRGVDAGFRPDKILSLTVFLTKSKYPDGRAGAAYFERVIERIRALPGVEAVGANMALPLTPMGTGMYLPEIEGHPPLTGPDQFLPFGLINGDYFRAMGIPLKKGRLLSDVDRSGTAEAVLVNESFEKHYFPGEEALGRRIGSGANQMTIVGVVGDVRQFGPEDLPRPQLYRSYLWAGVQQMSLAVRSRGDPMKLASTIRGLLAAVDRDQPFADMMTLEQRLTNKLAPRRLSMLLSTSLGALAIGLAAVGIYGLLSFTAAQRKHEIGVRMALGAGKGDVLALILGEGLKLTLAGALLGVLAACALTRFLSSLLYAISPLDPTSFVAASLVLLAIALVSSYQPARRATKVDPIAALRNE